MSSLAKIRPLLITIALVVVGILLPFPYNFSMIIISPLPVILWYILIVLRRKGITTVVDEDMLYLVTHMYGVSTGRPPHEKLFNLYNVSGTTYKNYTHTLTRISNLAKRWGYGFVNAVKHQAKYVTNVVFKDFLLRLSEAINVGEDLELFLQMEQDTLTATYEADYTRVLEAIKILLGIYTAAMSSSIFINVNLILLSMLFLGDIQIIVVSFIASVTMLGLLVLLIRKSLPKQDIVHNMPINLRERKIYRYILTISIALSIALSTYIYYVFRKEYYVLITTGLCLLLPGFIGRKIENKVKNIENFFTVFIRSLGLAYTSLRNYVASLRSILRTEFGELTKPIQRLYARLRNGVDRRVAMYYFIGETGSEVVRKGMDIFYDSVEAGGDPAKVGQMISILTQRLVNLRKQREQIARAFQGTIYVLHVLMVALTEFVFTLVIILHELISTMAGTPYQILPVTVLPLDILMFVKIGLIFIITPLNAFAMQFARGGFVGSAWLHTSILLILSGATLLISSMFSQSIFAILNIEDIMAIAGPG